METENITKGRVTPLSQAFWENAERYPAPVEEAEHSTQEQMTALRIKRKELQRELHKLWLKRHTVMKLQRTAEISREQYEALGNMWEEAQEKLKPLLSEYRKVAHELSGRGCEYEEISAGREEGVSDTADAGAGRGTNAA